MKKRPGKRTQGASERPQGDSITVYYGEFLVSPCPLELSFNYCSHACAYCFANINKRARWADTQRTMKLIADMDKRDTLEAKLLRDRYPVVVSNRTDPFAASNYRQSVPILETMAACGIPIAMQTRGGRGVDEVLKFLPPSVWYISIPTLDEAGEKRRAPGAPTPAERLDLIRQVVEAGHEAVVGINPCVSQWIDDYDELASEIYEAGADGVWIANLHLSHKQLLGMTDREKEAIEEDVLFRARRGPTSCMDPVVMRMEESARNAGLATFVDGMPGVTLFWEPWRRCYPNLFPTVSDFVMMLDEANLDEDHLLSVDFFADYVDEYVPAGKWQVHHYIGAQAHDALSRRPMPSLATYRELIEYIWKDPRIYYHLSKWGVFQWAGDVQTGTAYTDERGFGYLRYNAAGGGEQSIAQCVLQE